MEKSLLSRNDPTSAQPQPEVSLGVIGVSFKTAQIEIREKLARKITFDSITELAKQDPAYSNSSELVLLSTCNRIEIYYYGKMTSLLDRLQELLGDNVNVYNLRADQAVTHLFNVAAGLDSLVVGEAQILAQVNEALTLSADHGLSGEVMSRLFSKAYETARIAREENPNFTNKTNYSVSHAVLELITKEFGSRRKPNLLLVGSGKMIRLAVRAIERSNLGAVIVANRKTTAIEGFKPDSVIGMSEIKKTISQRKIDVVITATSAEDYVLREQDIEGIKSPILILDISVPRNVDPKVGKLRGVRLLNLDDMRDTIGNSVEKDLDTKVREELSSGVEEFSVWLSDYEEISPLLSLLRKKAETIRKEELVNALDRMPELTESQRETIEKMSERLFRRFLHGPTLRLKKMSRTERNEKAKIYAEVISELFSS